MLASTAERLYWLSRYFERAGNTARLLEACGRMACLSAKEEGVREFSAALAILGASEDFGRRGEEGAEAIARFLAFDAGSPASILSSLARARQNARTLRSLLSEELWVTVNSAWLEAQDASRAADLAPFFSRMKECFLLFRALAFETLLRDESFDFMRLGIFIEGADNTARILDVKYHILLPEHEPVGGAVDYYQWHSLLRAVAAHEAYHRVFAEPISPFRVAELLILRHEVPQSLASCLEQIEKILFRLCEEKKPSPAFLAQAVHTRLTQKDIAAIFEGGLHEFLTSFCEDARRLDEEIRIRFFCPDFELAASQAQDQTLGGTSGAGLGA